MAGEEEGIEMVKKEEKRRYLNGNGGQDSGLSWSREKAYFVYCFPSQVLS